MRIKLHYLTALTACYLVVLNGTNIFVNVDDKKQISISQKTNDFNTFRTIKKEVLKYHSNFGF